MPASVRTAGLLAALLACPTAAVAATPKEIDAAIKKGADALKARYAPGAAGVPLGGGSDSGGIGGTCLAGLALLEAGVPPTDAAVKRITELVRAAAYTQTQTYQVALCLMYLDRHGDPADVPAIQMLAVRLLAGQTANGGWGYGTISPVSQADEQRLRAMKPGQAGKFHPEVEKYYEALRAARAGGGANTPAVVGGDDNSNTQFGVLAVWLSRKHGVPVDRALDLIEARFLATQSARTGSWSYNGPVMGGPAMEGMGSPSMYCAGLIGLATGVARREEKARPKEDPPAKPDPDPKPTDPKKNPDDPFFNPPPKGGDVPPKKNPPPRQLTPTDRAVQFALAGLGAHLAESAKAGRGPLVLRGEGHGRDDLYFFWSLERVGVVFGLDKIGGVDWYEAGAHTLVYSQFQDGGWGGAAGIGTEVNTAFAVLFLSRSNLARDLAGKVQKETGTEMKAGTLHGTGSRPGTDPTAGATNPGGAPLFLPGVTGNEAATLAAELLRSTEKDWGTVLKKLRETKGTVHTQALTAAVSRLDGDRRKAAREALAERLARMTPATLRAMAKDEDAELRRAAVLAMAMKDDKAHIPDLVAAILDEEDIVVRAARAGLRSLTNGEDFGPAANATAGEKFLASESWKKWMNAQK